MLKENSLNLVSILTQRLNFLWSGNQAKFTGSYLQLSNTGYSQKKYRFHINTNLFQIFLTNSQKCLNIWTFFCQESSPRPLFISGWRDRSGAISFALLAPGGSIARNSCQFPIRFFRQKPGFVTKISREAASL